MSLSILIIDGYDKTEAGEANLVLTLAVRDRKFSDVHILNDFRGQGKPGERIEYAYSRYWDLVWFAGHCAVLWKGNKPTRPRFEQRNGCTFLQLTAGETFARRIQASLVVLSACRTVPGSRFFPHLQNVEMAIGQRRKIWHGTGLAFAARFMSELTCYMRRDYLEEHVIRRAFNAARDCNWRLIDYRRDR